MYSTRRHSLNILVLQYAQRPWSRRSKIAGMALALDGKICSSLITRCHQRRNGKNLPQSTLMYCGVRRDLMGKGVITKQCGMNKQVRARFDSVLAMLVLSHWSRNLFTLFT